MKGLLRSGMPVFKDRGLLGEMRALGHFSAVETAAAIEKRPDLVRTWSPVLFGLQVQVENCACAT